MKLFVGTLHSRENEFEECVASIESQTYDHYEHFVFEDYAHKEAHDVLYRTFQDKSDEFDLLVKVDADMVLNSDTFFERVVDVMQGEPELLDLEIAVQDFFTDRLVWGLHVYRKTVEFQRTDEDLFVDVAPIPDAHHRFDSEQLAPAAEHCRNPSFEQAFMHGLKRGLKGVHPREWELEKGYVNLWLCRLRQLGPRVFSHDESRERTTPLEDLPSHWEAQEIILDRFRRVRDPRLGASGLGFEIGVRGELSPEELDYSGRVFEEMTSRYEDRSPAKLLKAIRSYRRKNFGFLPTALRKYTLKSLFQIGATGCLWS